MTRLERKEKELQKLYEYRTAAMRTNNLLWLSQNRIKIEALEKEVIEMRNEAKKQMEEHYNQRVYSLTDTLDRKPADVRAAFYVAILRISMLADAVNEACEEVNQMMREEFNAIDFTLKKEVREMTALSQNIASFVCSTGAPTLQDCIVNDDKFVDACMRLATKHITSKLKIKVKV